VVSKVLHLDKILTVTFCLWGRGPRVQRKTRTVLAWILSIGWKSVQPSKAPCGSC